MHAKHVPPALRVVATLAALSLMAAACGGATSNSAPLPVGIEIPEPTIDWERSIDRLTYVGAGSAPTDREVQLVAAVIDDVPTALVAKTDVRWVVRAIEQTAVRSNHPSAVAFAVGPDIYLLERAFNLSEGGSTRFDLGRAVAHEIVHVSAISHARPRLRGGRLDR